MTRIAIVYHSGYGHTHRQAQAVQAGAQQAPGIEALLLNVEEAQTRWEDLAAADAIIFGTPTYMAGPSAALKAFFEATSHSVFAQGFAWKDKTNSPPSSKFLYSPLSTACIGSISGSRLPTTPVLHPTPA